MSAVITGTVVSSVDLSAFGGGSQYYTTCIPGLSLDEQFVYLGTTGFGRRRGVLRFPMTNFTNAGLVELYAQDFFAADPIQLFCWDYAPTKLFAVLNDGTLVTANLDGSSSSPTVLQGISTQSAFQAYPVPGSDRVYYGHLGTKGVPYIDVATASDGNLCNTVEFTGSMGPCRYAADSLLMGVSSNSPGYLKEFYLPSGHPRAIAGNGTQGGGFGNGNAFEVPVDEFGFLSSDEDGRIYFHTKKLVAGVISDVPNTGSRTAHAFASTLLVSGNAYEFRKLS